MGNEQGQGWCEYCGGWVLARRRTPNHILHLLLSIVTAGIWLAVWLLAAIFRDNWRCQRCGSLVAHQRPALAHPPPTGLLPEHDLDARIDARDANAIGGGYPLPQDRSWTPALGESPRAWLGHAVGLALLIGIPTFAAIVIYLHPFG